MDINLERLGTLISHQPHKIEKAVSDTGYLPKTVIGGGNFLLDNQGDFDLRPLLEASADD
jgi:hypothetical protein